MPAARYVPSARERTVCARSRGFIFAYFPPHSPKANISLTSNACQYRICEANISRTEGAYRVSEANLKGDEHEQNNQRARSRAYHRDNRCL